MTSSSVWRTTHVCHTNSRTPLLHSDDQDCAFLRPMIAPAEDIISTPRTLGSIRAPSFLTVVAPALVRHLTLFEIERLSRSSSIFKCLLENSGTYAIATGRPLSFPPEGAPGPRWLRLYFHYFVIGKDLALDGLDPARVARYPEVTIREFEDWVPPLGPAERAAVTDDQSCPVYVMHRCPRSIPERTAFAGSPLFKRFQVSLRQTTVLEAKGLEDGAALCYDSALGAPTASAIALGRDWMEVRLHRQEAVDPDSICPNFWISRKAALRRVRIQFQWKSS